MASRRDIGMFISSLDNGGAQRVFADLATEFDKRGYDVELVLHEASGAYMDTLSSGVDIADFNSSRAITSLPELVRYLREERPRVLLSTLTRLNIIAVCARELTRKDTRLVLRSANIESLIPTSNLRMKFVKSAVRYVYPRADHIIAISKGVKADLTEVHGLDPEQITVVYNPVVSPALFDMATEAVDHPWFGADIDADVVLGVGRLADIKDFSTLVRAVARLRELREVRLVILGKGERRDDLQQLATGLGIEEYVSLPGFVDNPYAYMSKADVFAMSSKAEGLGNALIEAMACGTPVVATNCPGGPPETLVDGKYGPLVPVGDPDALAEGIRTALTNPVDSDALRNRAMDYSVETITDEYEQILFPDTTN